MDKLQPLIRHHFWILFLLTLIMPPVGWWMARGALTTEIDSRTTALDGAFGQIPSGANAPNENWAQGVQQLNTIRKEENRLALERLWNNQKKLEIWPPNVAQYMVSCPYRGEVEDAKVRQTVPTLYREDYEREIRRVWLLVEPVDDGRFHPDEGARKNVLFPFDRMPRVPQKAWETVAPTWREIWNAQEDLWLLSELFQAVRRVNEGATSIVDADVRSVIEVQFFGGKRTDPTTLGSATAAATSGAPDTAMAMPDSGFSSVPGGGVRRSAKGLPADFPLSEEYEAILSNATAGGMMGGYDPSGIPSGADPTAASATATEGDGDAARYIAQSLPDVTYRTRGFKLKLAVTQMKMLEVVRQLSNSAVPLEVTRFQFSAMNPPEPDAAGTANPFGSGGPGGFASGGGPAGYSPTGAFGPPDMATGFVESSVDSAIPSSADPAGMSPYGGSAGFGGGAGLPQSNNPLVQAALKDSELLELVIVGEFYLYNQPEAAPADAAAPAAPAADAVAPEAAPAGDSPVPDVAPAAPATEAASPAAVDPAAVTPPAETPVPETVPAPAPADAPAPAGSTPTPSDPATPTPAAPTAPAAAPADPAAPPPSPAAP